MKLSELAVKPKLSKVTITEEHIVEKYGEELDFYIWDRQPLDIFAKLRHNNRRQSNAVYRHA